MWEWLLEYWFETLVGVVISILGAGINSQRTKTKAVCLGVQALLRSQMIHDYNHYRERGFAPIYARENFENVWRQYHNLGANGVMDDLHEKFMELPTGGDER